MGCQNAARCRRAGLDQPRRFRYCSRPRGQWSKRRIGTCRPSRIVGGADMELASRRWNATFAGVLDSAVERSAFERARLRVTWDGRAQLPSTLPSRFSLVRGRSTTATSRIPGEGLPHGRPLHRRSYRSELLFPHAVFPLGKDRTASAPGKTPSAMSNGRCGTRHSRTLRARWDISTPPIATILRPNPARTWCCSTPPS